MLRPFSYVYVDPGYEKVFQDEKKPKPGYDCNHCRMHMCTKCKYKYNATPKRIPANKIYTKMHKRAPHKNSIQTQTLNSFLSRKNINYTSSYNQLQFFRHRRLKALAADAEEKKKIFVMNRENIAIRNALVERGWIEKLPRKDLSTAKKDLSTTKNSRHKNNSESHRTFDQLHLSNLVEKSLPNFIWNMGNSWDSETKIQNRKVIHNRLRTATPWATKQGLCASSRKNCWFYIEGVADMIIPRTYNSSFEIDKEEFDIDYKLTACTSLLKWTLCMVENNRPIFVETGNISTDIIAFALNRCKEYLFQRQNRDIDQTYPATSNTQWMAFFKKYYILVAKQGAFKSDNDNKFSSYLRCAKFMLTEIQKYRPQLSCEGCHNIWIIKPICSNRGKGITIESTFDVLTDLSNKGRYIFQKYIEEPMLIHETKFDVRQYYLVTSTFPLVIWMYQDCYLKFSSQKYDLNNYNESIHLTNNAVQKKYKNCQNRHPELPENNMWKLDSFKEYLVKIGRENVWDTTIFPEMKKSIVGIMLSCQDSISDWKNRFELYGCDFILDKDYKPWLIEINFDPDLTPTTEVTAEFCPIVLTDVIKVLIDRAENPRASTGKFECIYSQNISMIPFNRTEDLIVQGTALPKRYFYTDQYSLSSVYKQLTPELQELEVINPEKLGSPNSQSHCMEKDRKIKRRKKKDCPLGKESGLMSSHENIIRVPVQVIFDMKKVENENNNNRYENKIETYVQKPSGGITKINHIGDLDYIQSNKKVFIRYASAFFYA